MKERVGGGGEGMGGGRKKVGEVKEKNFQHNYF